MSLLSAVTMGGEPQPPRVVIYGPDGIGKTTFAASAPRPIVQQTEDGLKTIRVPTFPRVATSYAEVMDGIYELATTDHPFQTYVLDTLDWLEPLVWKATCEREGWANIEAPGYGKGYVSADTEWRQFLALLDQLRDRGMAVICVAHAEIKRFDAPDSEPYDRYQVKLHTRGAKLIREWADVVGFAKWEVFTKASDVGFNKSVTRGVGAGTRMLAVEERPAYHAKNRYQLPAELPLSWPALEERISAALAVGAEFPDWLKRAAPAGDEEPRWLMPQSDNADMPIAMNAAAEREMEEALRDVEHSDDCACGLAGDPRACDCPAGRGAYEAALSK